MNGKQVHTQTPLYRLIERGLVFKKNTTIDKRKRREQANRCRKADKIKARKNAEGNGAIHAEYFYRLYDCQEKEFIGKPKAMSPRTAYLKNKDLEQNSLIYRLRYVWQKLGY